MICVFLQGLGPAVPGIKRQRAGTSAGRSGRGAAPGSDVRETGLRRQLGALGCPAYSIAIADQWLACSGGATHHVICMYYQSTTEALANVCRHFIAQLHPEMSHTISVPPVCHSTTIHMVRSRLVQHPQV